MQTNKSKSATFLKSVLAASVLLLGGGAALAQQVNLTAAASNAAMPDGTAVPMWGYSCGAAPAGGSSATCSALNRAVAAAQAAVAAGTATTAQAALAQSWSPVIITVPSGQDLRIYLTNGLPTGVPT